MPGSVRAGPTEPLVQTMQVRRAGVCTITLHYITITTEDGNTTTFNLGKDFLIVKKIFLITAGRIIRGSPCNYDTNQFPN